MTIDDILARTKALRLPPHSYVIFGSGPLAAVRIREVNDVDMLVSKGLHEDLKRAGWEQAVKATDDKPLVKDEFEAHDNWNFSPYAPTLEELLSRAFIVDGIPFASIEDVRKWKAASGGPKHEADVELIDAYIALQQAVQEVAKNWAEYLATIGDWRSLIKGIKPKIGGCGDVYELPARPDRSGESFAIADMRRLKMSEPHKHINGETEIYYVLQGKGKMIVGGELRNLFPGTHVITPPDTAHITLPDKDLVIAVVNTPPFNINNVVTISEEDEAVAGIIAELKASSPNSTR